MHRVQTQLAPQINFTISFFYPKWTKNNSFTWYPVHVTISHTFMWLSQTIAHTQTLRCKMSGIIVLTRHKAKGYVIIISSYSSARSCLVWPARWCVFVCVCIAYNVSTGKVPIWGLMEWENIGFVELRWKAIVHTGDIMDAYPALLVPNLLTPLIKNIPKTGFTFTLKLCYGNQHCCKWMEIIAIVLQAYM